MIKCPFCHFDNEDGVLFCERCTSDLTVVAPPPPAVPIPPAVPMAEAVAVPLAMEASNLEAVPLATAEPIEAIAVEPIAPAAATAQSEPVPVVAVEAMPTPAPPPPPPSSAPRSGAASLSNRANPFLGTSATRSSRAETQCRIPHLRGPELHRPR